MRSGPSQFLSGVLWILDSQSDNLILAFSVFDILFTLKNTKNCLKKKEMSELINIISRLDCQTNGKCSTCGHRTKRVRSTLIKYRELDP